MEYHEFNNQMPPLMKSLWPKQAGDLNDEQWNIYWMAAKQYPIGAVCEALRDHASASKFFPRPSELRNRCKANTEPTKLVRRISRRHEDEEALRDQIALEETEDALTLFGVSDEQFAGHLESAITKNPKLEHLRGLPKSDRMAQAFVCDEITGFKFQGARGFWKPQAKREGGVQC